MGHNKPQNYSKYHLVSLLDEKQRSTFDIFVPFFTPLDALTNSAMHSSEIGSEHMLYQRSIISASVSLAASAHQYHQQHKVAAAHQQHQRI